MAAASPIQDILIPVSQVKYKNFGSVIWEPGKSTVMQYLYFQDWLV